MYPYDFQTCGHVIVDRVRAILESQRDWDFSGSATEAEDNCTAAAQRFGFKTLLNPEHTALAQYLVAKRAGLQIATYAWGTYVDMVSTKQGDNLTPA